MAQLISLALTVMLMVMAGFLVNALIIAIENRTAIRITEQQNLISPIRLCRDCRWCKARESSGVAGVFDVCKAPSAPEEFPEPRVSLVTGNPRPPITVYCDAARERSGFCGPSGMYYEARKYPRWLAPTLSVIVTLLLLVAAATIGWALRAVP